MSTYRYRGTDGVIDISAHSLVTDDFSTTAFTVVGSEAITSQGMHLQWNKIGSSGSGYIISQKGLGSLGGLVLGTSTTGDVFTEGFSVYTDSAIAGISTTTGRLAVTGTSSNASAPTGQYQLSQNYPGGTVSKTLNCTTGGFAFIDFIKNGGATNSRIIYSPVDDSLSITCLGPTYYSGQVFGTVARQPSTYIGAAPVTSTAAATTNARVLRLVSSTVSWTGAGLKLAYAFPEKGHYMVSYLVLANAVTSTNLYIATLSVDAAIQTTFTKTIANTESAQVAGGVIFVDILVAGAAVTLETVGAGTSGNTCVFEIGAARIG